MPFDQLQISNTIQHRLTRAAEWRREQIVRFPGDNRNQRAAHRLDELAQANFADVSDTTKAKLSSVARSPRLPGAVSAAARDVVFRRWPEDLDGFLGIVLERLAAPTRH